MTAGFGMPTAAQRPRCCRLYRSAPSSVRPRVCRCLAGLAGNDTVRRLDLRRDLAGEIRLTLSGLDGGGGPVRCQCILGSSARCRMPSPARRRRSWTARMSLGRAGERPRVRDLQREPAPATGLRHAGELRRRRAGGPDRYRRLTRRMQRRIWRVPQPIPALSTAAKTRIMLESFGPTYVKPGQIVSSQASALPDEWRMQLDRLQNEVPPVPTRRRGGSSPASWGRRRRSCTRPSPRGRWPRPRSGRCITPSWPTAPRWPSRCSGPAWTGRFTETWGWPGLMSRYDRGAGMDVKWSCRPRWACCAAGHARLAGPGL
jgi:hypothetical protein